MSGPDVAFFDIPFHSRMVTTLGLVSALRARGMRVDYYSLPQYDGLVGAVGARLCAMAPFGPAPPNGTLQERVLRYTLDHVEALAAALRARRPSVVVFTSKCLWAAAAADLVGLPTVAVHTNYPLTRGFCPPLSLLRRSWSLAELPEQRRFLKEDRALLRALQARYALPRIHDEDLHKLQPNTMNLRGDHNLYYAPASLAAGQRWGEHDHFTGPCYGPRPMDDGPVLAALGGEPLIFVSLGSIPDYNSRLGFFGAVVQALSAQPRPVLISTGRGQRAEDLGPLPDHFTVADYVPQLAVLDRAACFLTHGGTNSVWEAMLAGVPMVVFPQGGDQHLVGWRLEQLGAGRWIHEARPDAETIRAACETALADEGQRRRVVALGDELRAAGGAEAAAAIVQGVVEAA